MAVARLLNYEFEKQKSSNLNNERIDASSGESNQVAGAKMNRPASNLPYLAL